MFNKITLIFLVFSSFVVMAQEVLTLEDCIGKALKNNNQLTSAVAKVKKAEAGTDEANAAFFPAVSVDASYTRLSDVPDFEINLPVLPAPVTVQESILNSYMFKAGLIQPLFTGFRISSIKNASEYKLSAVKEEFKASRDEVVFKVVSAYWNARKADAVLKLIDKNITGMEEHLKDTKAFLDNGLVTYNDYLKIELELSRLKLRRIDAANMFELAKNNLAVLTGYQFSGNMEIDSSAIKLTDLQYNYENLKQDALANRPELKSSENYLSASEEGIKGAQSGYFPSVYLFGNYYYSRPNQRYMPAVDEFNDTWDAGVSFRWELWHGGGTSAKVEQARQDKITAEANIKIVKDFVMTDLLKAYLDYNSSIGKIEVNEKAVNSAKENYRLMKERYSGQLATSTELTDAENLLLDAEINLFNAKAELKIAEVSLQKAAGLPFYRDNDELN